MSEDVEITLINFDRNEMYDPQTDSWTILNLCFPKEADLQQLFPLMEIFMCLEVKE